MDERVEILAGEEGSVRYAVHTREGLRPTAPDTAEWRVLWRVPAAGTGDTLFFHLAANAADYDDSEFGDVIYIRTLILPY